MMEERTLEFMRKAADGKILMGSGETIVKEIFTDSRAPVPGGAFLAVCGDRFDGHDFIESTAQAGCRVFIVSRTEGIRFPEGSSVLCVKDTTLAYGQIAAAYRNDFPGLKVIAVCGSNGKTTTKDLIAAVLAKKGKVLSNLKSFNNHIGVPQTLLQITSDHQYAVVEVGTNHPGELVPLLKWIAPTHGVLTSIGNEHLEFFKNVDGVVAEEGTLAESLPENGVLFINADSYGYETICGRLNPKARKISIGCKTANADWIGRLLGISCQGTTFEIFHKAKEMGGFQGDIHVKTWQVRPLGAHQVTNALLAIAVARELGVPENDIADALRECPPSDMRAQVRSVNGMTLLVDCYNANLDSVYAALETLRSLQPETGGKRVAILGTMGELGETACEVHKKVAHRAAVSGVDIALFCGQYADEMKAVFEREGQTPSYAKSFDTLESLLKEVDSNVSNGDCVLIKASRAQRFEKIVERLEGKKL
ncbi:MAG: UDP-N-acetylmuramoyl-tripeptide--D-alanyl-D-alanine ligase [Verrucomicrobia bacterium]|nr:UDP-N-acetylmuramoyl-tripeptide--D-alanyl-D-alanine ligase [Verrucomicrobiota bacterium]